MIDDDDLTVVAVMALLENISTMTPAEQEALLADLELFEHKKAVEMAKVDFIAFCVQVYPNFKVGPHHRHLRPLLQGVKDGTQPRITCSMPPRFGKSETIAYLFVAWYLGHFPRHQIMMVTHTADLSADFGRKVRNLLDSDVYREIFPDTVVARDKSAASNWSTTLGGKYLAIGIGANVAGHGADLLIGDDLCIAQGTAVHTLAGIRKASDVQVGDWLLGEKGYQCVIRKTHSTHEHGVRVDGVTMSLEHPVWTFNRGWVRAGSLTAIDVLRTISFYDKIKSSLCRLYAKRIGQPTTQTVPTGVQHLGDDEAAVRQPEGGKLYKLWCKGRNSITRVRAVCRLSTGIGSLPKHSAHAGQERQQQGLFCGQLPLGGCGDAAEQSHKRGSLRARWADVIGTTTSAQSRRPHSTDGTSAKEDGVDAGTSIGFTETELGAAPRIPEDFGWLKHSAARFVGRSSKVRAGAGVDTHPSVAKSAAQNAAAHDRGRLSKAFIQCHKAWHSFVGALLGVRLCGAVEHVGTAHDAFVNFEVEGDNTFFAGAVLTHNCSEQAILSSDPGKTFAQAWEYMQVGPLQRLMPGGKIIMIGTRWSKKDPIGLALQWAEQNSDSTPWHEVRFPAIINEKSLWPEQWPLDQLLAKKAGMFPQFWAAQYMQEPTSEEGALVKREWWRAWTKDKPPKCEFLLQSWDTAHGANDAADPSAVHTWGIWYNEEEEQDQLILLDAWTGRKEFPELKKFALEYYQEWEPDSVIIEKKAAGAPLIQELRRIGVPVQEYTPSRGADKRVRINSVADIFASGMVWAPETRWAKEVIDEIASFPNADHDEHVDCFVAGTKVRMADGGECNIECVREGSFVATPFGPRKVLISVTTGRHPVWEVNIGGNVLCGTGNHPIFTGDKWTALDKLQIGVHTGYFYQGVSQWPSPVQAHLSRLESSMGTSTVDTLMQKRKYTGTTLHALGSCYTALSGSIFSALSLLGIIYTTRTKTRATILWGTSSVLHPHNTTLRTQGLHTNVTRLLRSLSTLSIFGQQLQNGISLLKGLHGTNSMQATTVQKPVPQSPRMGIDKSPTHATGAVPQVAQTIYARSSVPPFAKQQNLSLGAVRAVQNTHTTQAVYNIAVEGAHCFFANDVLVHNCCSQALMRFRQGGFIRLKSDEKDDDNVFSRRRAAYY